MPTLTLQPGPVTGFDNYNNEANPNAARDAETQVVFKGAIGSGIHRTGFIRFDLSSIPGGALVTAATLSLWRGSDWHNGAYTIYWYRILAANSNIIEACTWNYADGAGAAHRWAGDVGNDGGPDAGCTQAGVDFSATVLGSRAVDSEAQDTQLDFELSTIEMENVLPANYGFAGQCETLWQNKGFWSSNYATAAHRPRLVVSYITTASKASVFWPGIHNGATLGGQVVR